MHENLSLSIAFSNFTTMLIRAMEQDFAHSIDVKEDLTLNSTQPRWIFRHVFDIVQYFVPLHPWPCTISYNILYNTDLEAVDRVGDIKAVEPEEDAPARWHVDGHLAILAVRIVTSAQVGNDPPVAVVDEMLALTVDLSLDEA